MYPPNNNFVPPFVRQLEGPMHHGRVVAVYGTIPHHANRFEVNLQCGGGPSRMSDIALHLNVRFDQHAVVRNSLQGGNWQHEESDGPFPHQLRPGGHFQLLLLCDPHCFKIAFNGQHFHEFHHRVPLERITHVGVEGDVEVNNVSGVMDSNARPEHQTHNPSVPHVQNIGHVFPGRCIRVRGFVPHNAYRFSVNLATGPSMDYDDICLHVSTRPTEGIVELNTCRRGGWEQGQQMRSCPVRLGQPFEIMVLVDEHNYKIAYNGVHFAEWPHRMPYQSVDHLIVEGTVQLQLVSFEGRPRPGGGLGGGFSAAPLPLFPGGPGAPGGHHPHPPPHAMPHFPSPYDNVDHKHHHYPNPYLF